MTAFEKHFVNRPAHTANVARHAEGLLERIGLQPGWRYLDVGCGVGAADEALAEKTDLDVTGIDFDPEQIAAAQARPARPNLHFLVMDATKLEFPDGAFDVVTARYATHHMAGWERAFAEMIRVLRPGGYLIYSDLMFPLWLDGFRRLLRLGGTPSAKRVEFLAAQAGLSPVHQARAGLQHDYIWRQGKLNGR
jgi:ubiquinone/menaquinone biosynthesis C-methylase UbiE